MKEPGFGNESGGKTSSRGRVQHDSPHRIVGPDFFRRTGSRLRILDPYGPDHPRRRGHPGNRGFRWAGKAAPGGRAGRTTDVRGRLRTPAIDGRRSYRAIAGPRKESGRGDRGFAGQHDSRGGRRPGRFFHRWRRLRGLGRPVRGAHPEPTATDRAAPMEAVHRRCLGRSPRRGGGR